MHPEYLASHPKKQTSTSSLQQSKSIDESEVDLASKLRHSQDYFFNSKSRISEDNFITNDRDRDAKPKPKDIHIDNTSKDIEESEILEHKPDYDLTESFEKCQVSKVKKSSHIKRPNLRQSDLISKPSSTKYKSRTNSIQLTKAPVGFNNQSSLLLGRSESKLVSRDQLMHMYLKSYRKSEENLRINKNLMDIDDLKDFRESHPRPLFKKSHTVGKFALQRNVNQTRAKPRLTQARVLGMMQGFNQIVQKATRNLESKQSIAGHTLNELPDKLVQALTKKVKKPKPKKKHTKSINTVLKR